MGGQGRCERGSKFLEKKIGGGVGSGGSGWGGGQGGCERRIEVCEKINKKNSGGVGGFRVDVTEPG